MANSPSSPRRSDSGHPVIPTQYASVTGASGAAVSRKAVSHVTATNGTVPMAGSRHARRRAPGPHHRIRDRPRAGLRRAGPDRATPPARPSWSSTAGSGRPSGTAPTRRRRPRRSPTPVTTSRWSSTDGPVCAGAAGPGTFADVSAAVDAVARRPDAAGPLRPRRPLGRRAPRRARGDPTARPGRWPGSSPWPATSTSRSSATWASATARRRPSWATPTTPPGRRPTPPPIRCSPRLVLIHGEADDTVPVEVAEQLLDRQGPRRPTASCSGCPASATWRSSSRPSPPSEWSSMRWPG